MKLRLFVALMPPKEVRRELAEMQSELEAAHPSGVQWVPPEKVHLTLRFLGSVPEADVLPIEDSVSAAAACCPPLHLQVCGGGGFPTGHRARVLWAGLGNGDAIRLGDLVRDLERRLIALGLSPGDQVFHPHLTLGRARGRHGVSGMADALANLGRRKAIPWQVAQAHLVRSHLSPAGARYEVIHNAELKDGRPKLDG